MELSIRMLAIVVMVLIVLVVAIVLVTGWFGVGNDQVNGLFKFFQDMLSGKTIPQGGLAKPG